MLTIQVVVMPLVVIVMGMTTPGQVASEGVIHCNLPVTKICALRDGMLRSSLGRMDQTAICCTQRYLWQMSPRWP